MLNRCVSLFFFVQAWQQNRSTDEPDKDFLIVALDLLSGLIQGLGDKSEPLIVSAQPSFIEILIHCVKVRQ